jgi:16S rRNA (uracil1498-N3)-methyltransferase
MVANQGIIGSSKCRQMPRRCALSSLNDPKCLPTLTMPPRFYIEQELTVTSLVSLPAGAQHHALKVLRLNDGEPIGLFNGDGYAYAATIHIQGKQASAHILTRSVQDQPNPIKLILMQSLCTAEKMDWAIEKAVELGADGIEPIVAARSKIKLEADRAQQKLLRWKELIVAACAQCGRNTVPTIELPKGLSTLDLKHLDLNKNLILLMDTLEHPPLLAMLSQKRAVSPVETVRLVIGPESGFTDQERHSFAAQGAISVSLGWRILRTETAGLAALAAIQALMFN